MKWCETVLHLKLETPIQYRSSILKPNAEGKLRFVNPKTDPDFIDYFKVVFIFKALNKSLFYDNSDILDKILKANRKPIKYH